MPNFRHMSLTSLNNSRAHEYDGVYGSGINISIFYAVFVIGRDFRKIGKLIKKGTMQGKGEYRDRKLFQSNKIVIRCMKK